MKEHIFVSHYTEGDGFATPRTEPLEELVLELSEPSMKKMSDGSRRAQAKARLIYVPGEQGKREVESKERFLFTAPMGAIDNEELRWYLERYYTWPTGVFKQRAEKVEKLLPVWGQAIYDAALNHTSVGHVLEAWNTAKGDTGRRFTVYVDSRLVAGTQRKSKKQAAADEAAAMLLALPWELIYKEGAYLFQGARPVRVRRRLPNKKSFEGSVSEPPIRVLLVSPRPEDDRAGYIDHRVSALPLVAALETLGDLVRLTVLTPPTFPAMVEELRAARKAGTPYHVVHFDGHGVYDPLLGLGGLCFEDPEDKEKPEKRRSKIVDAEDLAAEMRDYRIPLFFLEACQTAKAEEDPTASVAAALVDEGIASVVAMSHIVLVETARRFVETFYRELAKGLRVGDAMTAGQAALKMDSYRMKIFGAGRLELQDWFVPVLYQERDDVQLLTRVPLRVMEELDREAFMKRLGFLPETPGHQFIGRSRELLKLERLLERAGYAVVCGQGGEGKTTLAVELGRWLARTNRFRRVVFVSVENVNDVRTVVDVVGRQLVEGYTVAQFSPAELLTKALQPIERALRESRTLIIIDNMESILPHNNQEKVIDKSFSGVQGAALQKSPLVKFEPEALESFFVLCRKLQTVGETRLLFTSRQALPAPFDMGACRVTLGRLTKGDAVELVHRAMTAAGLTPKEDEKGGTQFEVEALVESVNCHARSLVLLAPYIGEFGVGQTTESLGRLMAELHKKYPDERERSLFASVELSLGRLSEGNREKVKALGVFQGGGHISIIEYVLELTEPERELLVNELVRTGLAEPMAYGFLRFHPALCPYLRRELEEEEGALEQVMARWAESMRQLSVFLYQQLFKDAQLSLNLTVLELPNLMSLLDYVRAQGDPELTVDLATSLEQLIEDLGRKHLLARVAAVREEESKKLPDWSNVSFNSSKAQIERLLGSGHFPRALEEAKALLEKCLRAGEGAYPGADYDTAMAFILIGRVLRMGGASGAALPPIEEARERFQRLADGGNTSAAKMASVSLAEKGDCLLFLGRLDEAAEVYEENIKRAEKLNNDRQVAAVKSQLGTVRMLQKRYADALKAYEEARKIFEDLDEPLTVAGIWHQTGRVHEDVRRFEAAEQAYRKALGISVQQNDPAGEASSLDQLGILYEKMNRLEESVTFHKKAADIRFTLKDQAAEGRSRNNLAIRLFQLKRYADARGEILRAIECIKPYGHAAEPWKTFHTLHNLEKAEGNEAAAANAREEAIRLYLAYRRDGGENHEPGGRLCYWFREALQTQPQEEIENQLIEWENDPEVDSTLKPLIPKLRAILSGSRDPVLAADPELDFDDAAEIMLLLEEGE